MRHSVAEYLTAIPKHQVSITVLINSTSAQWGKKTSTRGITLAPVSTLAAKGFPLPFTPAVLHDLQLMYSLYIPDEDRLECLPPPAVNSSQQLVPFTPTLGDLLTLTQRMLQVQISIDSLTINRKFQRCLAM